MSIFDLVGLIVVGMFLAWCIAGAVVTGQATSYCLAHGYQRADSTLTLRVSCVSTTRVALENVK